VVAIGVGITLLQQLDRIIFLGTYPVAWIPMISFIGICSIGWLLRSYFSSIIGTSCGAEDSSYCGEFEICIVSPTCVGFIFPLGLLLLLTLFPLGPTVSTSSYTISISCYISSTLVVDASFLVVIDGFGAMACNGGVIFVSCDYSIVGCANSIDTQGD
jgi:hypothetical protein